MIDEWLNVYGALVEWCWCGNWCNLRKTCLSATSSTTKLRWTDLWRNMGLHDDRLVTNHLIHVTAFCLYVNVTLLRYIPPIHLFIHAFGSLFYDRSTPSSKASSPHVQSSASAFNFRYPHVSLRSCSSCLRLLPHILITSIFPSILPPIPCFRMQFLCTMWPLQLAFLLLLYVGYSCPPWLYVILCHFVTWSVQLLLSILLQHHISKLLKYYLSTVLTNILALSKMRCNGQDWTEGPLNAVIFMVWMLTTGPQRQGQDGIV